MKAAESDDLRHRMDSQGFYKLDVPQKLNMARVMVDYWAEHGRANDVAVYYLDQKITFGELKDLSDRFAMALHNLGVSKGDRFVIRTPNQPEYMVAFLGGQKIGAVPIPTNIMLREGEIQHIINNSGAVAAVTTAKYIDVIENIRPNCKNLKHIIVVGGVKKKDHLAYEKMIQTDARKLPFIETSKNDPAYFLYTSGTTGAPKGVVHCHRFVIGAGDPIGKFTMGCERGDIVGGPTALTWMYALGHKNLKKSRISHSAQTASGSLVQSVGTPVATRLIGEYARRRKQFSPSGTYQICLRPWCSAGSIGLGKLCFLRMDLAFFLILREALKFGTQQCSLL